MPLRSALKIGCSNYKFHPIRMIATVLLAVFSFTFFGLSLALTTFNGVDPYVNAIYDNEYEYITIQKSFSEPYDYEGFTFDDFFVKNEYTSERVAVLPEDIATLQKYVSEDMMVVQRKIDGVVDLRRYIREWDDDFRKFVSQSSELITGKISGYMTITEEIIRQNGYELVGRLPQSINEAVMCEQHFNVYKYLGYKDDEGNEYEINDMEDIIGHTTFGFVITGVLKTGCDVACYNANHKEIIYYNENGDPIRSTPGDLNPYFFAIDNEYMFHEKLFVTHEYLVSTTTYTYEARENYIVFRKPEDKSEFKALTKFVLSFNNGFDRPGDFYEFAEVNETSQWYNAALVTSKPLRVLVLYVGVVFFIFTFVLLINFITTSVRGQMKQIGIISALGADFKQLYKIYFISAMVLCGIVYILSLITVGIGVAYLNSVGWSGFGFINLYGKPFNILSLNFVTIISLLAVSVVSALMGTILALRKMRKLSSAEIIRQGLIK
ncbi:MAG: ABC transporter permease [Clostridia bacterium]|nr:ABC transporter permease [Clostridia bacterium]